MAESAPTTGSGETLPDPAPDITTTIGASKVIPDPSPAATAMIETARDPSATLKQMPTLPDRIATLVGGPVARAQTAAAAVPGTVSAQTDGRAEAGADRFGAPAEAGPAPVEMATLGLPDPGSGDTGQDANGDSGSQPSDPPPSAPVLASGDDDAAAAALPQDPTALLAARPTDPSPSPGLADPLGSLSAPDPTPPKAGGQAVTIAGTATPASNVTGTSAAVNAAPTPVETPARPTPPPQLPATQVALAITRGMSADGSGTYTLQLRPEQLGIVNVRLEVDAKGRATASITADRPETLALLRQDAPLLLTSLKEAGINAEPGSLSFAMRDGTGESGGRQAERETGSGHRTIPGTDTPDPFATPSSTSPSPGGSRLYDIRA